MRAWLPLLLPAAVAASAGGLSLAGEWEHTGSTSEQYNVSATADATIFAAACTAGGCKTWKAAVITVTDAASGACIIQFTGQGRNHTGTVALPGAASIAWSDGSAWDKPGPPTFNVTVDVVVIPHTHDDAGWQRTFEGYYDVEVTPIINNVLAWLSENTTDDRRFNWVETSFLQRWWVDQNASTKAAFTAQLQSGRLEFVGGGWVMHDEESTSAYSATTNMEYGLSWLEETFGSAYRPRVLWQIDPSGHALLTPTLAAELGFDALVIDRIPDPVRQAFRRNLSLQFVWTGVQTAAAPPPAILAQVLDSFYCTRKPQGDTVAARAASFYADIARRARMYRPDAAGHITVLWPFGCDFSFQDESEFLLMTDVLAFLRGNAAAFPNVTARFGTLGDYFDTLHGQGIAWPMQGHRDFHAYRWCYDGEPDTDCTNLPTTPDPAYWRTGMYSSKVALKGLSRSVDASAHAGDALYALAGMQGLLPLQEPASLAAPALACALRGGAGCPAAAAGGSGGGGTPGSGGGGGGEDLAAALGLGRATLSLMTHHDAITGTAYETCSLGPPFTQCDCFGDYMTRMAAARGGTEAAQGALKAALLSLPPPALPLAPFGNATEASAGLTPGGPGVLVVAVGNPLAWARREVVRSLLLLPPAAGGAASAVTDLRTGAAVPSQLVNDTVRGTLWLYWLADVPPLSVVAYSVALTPAPAPVPVPAAAAAAGGSVTLNNGAIAVAFDASGRLASWTNVTSGASVPLAHGFYFYEEVVAGPDLIGGSVYGFEPAGNASVPLAPPPGQPIPVVVTAAGPFVWEATQLINGYTAHTLRLFAPEAAAAAAGARAAASAFAYAAALPLGSFAESQARMGPLPGAGLGGGSYVSQFTPGAGCAAPGAASRFTGLTSDASGFQVIARPPFDPAAYAQSQVWPAWPGIDWTFGACDGSGDAGGSGGLLSHIAQRPMGVAVASNTSTWVMLHRRILNPTDPRGNDSTVIDEAATLFVADPAAAAAGGAALLLQRQVQGRLAAHPLTLHAAQFPSAAAYLAAGGTPAFTPAWLAASLPPGVLLHSLTLRAGGNGSWYPPAPPPPAPQPEQQGGRDQVGAAAANAAAGLRQQQQQQQQQSARQQLPVAAAAAAVTVGLRLQQLPYAPPVSFDLRAWLGGGAAVGAVNETTLDFNADKAAADARRFQWRTLAEAEGGVEEGAAAHVAGAGGAARDAVRGAPAPVVFDVEYIKSFLAELTAP